MCIRKNLIAPYHDFSMPKRVAKNLKTRKIIILAPFSVIKSIIEIMKSQTQHKDILAIQSEITLLWTSDNAKCRVWDFVVQFTILSSKMWLKCRFFEFLGVLPLFWTIRIHLKEEWRHFPMHVSKCSGLQNTKIATCGIFSLSHIFRFYRAKNDHSWTLSFVMSSYDKLLNWRRAT